MKQIPVRRIVAALERAASRFIDPASLIRREAVRAVSGQSGFCEPMVAQALDWTFSEITSANLRRLLISDLGSDDAADDPALHSPRLTLVIAAGAIFQPAVNAVVFALLVKSPVAVKCSSHESALLPLFADALRETDPDVGGAVQVIRSDDRAAIPWPQAEAAVVYGSDETIAQLRGCAPAGAAFIGHGHKVSAAAVGREVLGSKTAAAQTARDLAVDIVMYEQSGCLSPHCVYVESGGGIEPEEFAAMLAEELDGLSRTFPPAAGIEQAAAIRAFRNEFEFLASQDKRVKYFWGEKLSYTLAVDPDPMFRLSPLGRTVSIKPVEDLSRLPEWLRLVNGHLQSIGAAPLERLRPLLNDLSALGASYFCELGRMQRPPIHWTNGGVPCLRSLLRNS